MHWQFLIRGAPSLAMAWVTPKMSIIGKRCCMLFKKNELNSPVSSMFAACSTLLKGLVIAVMLAAVGVAFFDAAAVYATENTSYNDNALQDEPAPLTPEELEELEELIREWLELLAQTPVYEILEGYWLWSGGYYVFNADGTGSRDWYGAEGGFEWYLDGDMLIIVQDGYWDFLPWQVQVIDFDSLTIGGALFIRAMDADKLAVPPVVFELAGIWEWQGGIYYFNPLGYGWRNWEASPGHFLWMATPSFIFMAPYPLEVGFIDAWPLYLYDEDNIVIGGAEMTRQVDPEPMHVENPSAVFEGLWQLGFDSVFLAFDAGGTGYIVEILPDETYEAEEIAWAIEDESLTLTFDDGYYFSMHFVILGYDVVRLYDEYGAMSLFRVE